MKDIDYSVSQVITGLQCQKTILQNLLVHLAIVYSALSDDRAVVKVLFMSSHYVPI